MNYFVMSSEVETFLIFIFWEFKWPSDHDHDYEHEHEHDIARTLSRYPCRFAVLNSIFWPLQRLNALTFQRLHRSRAAHVGTGAGIDLDGFAFFDEERDVNGFTGLEFRRLGHVAGGIAADAFG